MGIPESQVRALDEHLGLALLLRVGFSEEAGGDEGRSDVIHRRGRGDEGIGELVELLLFIVHRGEELFLPTVLVEAYGDDEALGRFEKGGGFSLAGREHRGPDLGRAFVSLFLPCLKGFGDFSLPEEQGMGAAQGVDDHRELSPFS